MLPLKVVEEVQALLAEGKLSQRKIAAKLKVSRGTVWAIATGKRGIFGTEVQQHDTSLPHLEMAAERCRGCGGLVLKPCLLCQARAYRRRKKRLAELAMQKVSMHKRVA